MKVTNSPFLFANLFVSVSDMLVKYFLITVKLRFSRFFWVVYTQKVSRISYQTAPPWAEGERPRLTKPNLA